MYNNFKLLLQTMKQAEHWLLQVQKYNKVNKVLFCPLLYMWPSGYGKVQNRMLDLKGFLTTDDDELQYN